MMISGAVLAAGMSSRMGRNKLLLPYENHTIIEEVLGNLSKVELGERMVIVGHDRVVMEATIRREFGDLFRIIYNDRYAQGRAESIKRAVENTAVESDALLFIVGDKPTVKSDLIKRAIRKFKQECPSILYVKTLNGRGHPVIFGKKLFEELMGLQGDIGAHDIIERYSNEVYELEDNRIQLDIDTEEDYRSIKG